MQPLLTSAQMREAEQETIRTFEIPELLLMEHAALALVQSLAERFGPLLPKSRGIVVAGCGNNGGDVLAAARLLFERGCQNIFIVVTEGTQTPSMAKQLALLARLGLAWGKEVTPELLSAADWILDGLIGTGLSRSVTGETEKKITLINSVAPRKWVVAADIPSGLHADTGNALGVAVRASMTVTFGFCKRGLVTGEAAQYVGDLQIASIQVPRSVSSQGWDCFLYDETDACRLPLRRKDSHKGDFGKVAILAGPPNREGAAALSALGALKTGAGLVTVYAAEQTLTTLRPRLVAEVMTERFEVFFERPADAFVVGPGLGTDAKAWDLFTRTIKKPVPCVIDADGLTLLATQGDPSLLAARKEHSTVLTPHPKEAAHLLNATVEQVQADRFSAIRELASRWKCSVILKGAGTLCSAPGAPIVAVRAGDSGLSKGGTGDVLSGILASFLAQGLRPLHAVPLAVYVHGKASERLTHQYGHSRSSLASEVAKAVADVLKDLELVSKPVF